MDGFLEAAIAREGLVAAPEAKRYELLRRLSFDLTGLPPTPEEVRAFESDESSDAYEKQVDRLLASKHYGERMAAYWLDLVRYADSVGYHSDNSRPLWRYRDWVVSEFNRNVPFDRFTLEQIAGDLLEAPTFEQKIASGYNRLLQTTEEGGAQPKEYRAIYLADRVRNVSTVWLGATLGCAQCHDHKFDPYLAKDFYSFGAFFADVVEDPVGRRKPTALPGDAERPLFEALEAEVERIWDELKVKTPDAAWEETIRKTPVCWTTLEPVSVSSKNGTRVLIQGNDFSLIATTANGPKLPADTYTVRFTTALRDITAFRFEAVPFEELPRGGPGRDPAGGFWSLASRFSTKGIPRFAFARRPVPGSSPRRTEKLIASSSRRFHLQARNQRRRSPSCFARMRAKSGPWDGSGIRHLQQRARLPRSRSRSLTRPQGDRARHLAPSEHRCSRKSSRCTTGGQRPSSRSSARGFVRR